MPGRNSELPHDHVALMLKVSIAAYVCGLFANDRPVKRDEVSGALEESWSLGW